MMKRALFLDRDGILNRVVFRKGRVSSPWVMAEFQLIPEAVTCVQKARQAGFLTIVITNQPDISRALMSLDELEKMHQFLYAVMPLTAIEVCVSADDCDPRRKPNPGMLVESAQRWNVSLKDSFFLGDSEKDVEAGRRAGVSTILLQTEYNGPIHGMADDQCAHLCELDPLWTEA